MQVKTYATSVPAPLPVNVSPFDDELRTRLVSTVTPRFLTNVSPAAATVFQSIVRVPLTGEYFITQANPGTNGADTPYQSFTISRCDSSGNLLASMKLNNGGHGSALGVEYVNGVSYIWTNYAQGTNMSTTPSHDLVRFPFTTGTYSRTNVPGIITYPKYDAGYNVYEFDWETDTLTVRNSSGTRDSYIRRKISEIKAGVNKTYGRMDLQQLPPTLQGFCTVNNSFFRFIGAPNGETLKPADPMAIQQYSWNTLKRVDQQLYPDLGRNSVGQFPGLKREPEGMSAYRDPATRRASVIFGMTMGQPGAHTWPIYILDDIGDVP